MRYYHFSDIHIIQYIIVRITLVDYLIRVIPGSRTQTAGLYQCIMMGNPTFQGFLARLIDSLPIEMRSVVYHPLLEVDIHFCIAWFSY